MMNCLKNTIKSGVKSVIALKKDLIAKIVL